jgi:eukaryotic-like serine/threonine-protein kinase
MLGTVLNSHYKIVKVLGIGKSGVTFLAEDLEQINSPLYVLKQIEPRDRSILPQLAEKLFEIQGTIAYRVGGHPQMPTLVAKFEDNGNRYLVREYIDGELLGKEISSGSGWSQTQVFDFLLDLVGILAFVHSFNYIHQDINPHNIIRRKDDGRFNLIGFSDAKDLENNWIAPSIAPSARESSYIPYEQEQGVSQFNSDLYAVGAIAIQAITGKFPLTRDADTYEIYWRDEVRDIDSKLLNIIDTMVRPDYRNRYRSALEVLEVLQAYAITQIPKSTAKFKPQMLIGTAACTLLLGFGVSKFPSASVNNSQLSISSRTAAAIASPDLNWHKYADRDRRIRIKYPPNWQSENIANIVTGELALFRSPRQNSSDRYRENISIRVEKLINQQMTLADYTQSSIAEITQYYRDIKITESRLTTLANKPANLVVYSGKDENSLAIENLEIWTIDRGKAYILTYKAEPERYQEFLATAMTTIKSFELK